MRLIEARVRMFKHILDSGPVAVEDGVTCLVGKNESGKTAFLQALQCLNPARETFAISAAKQYPAWLEKRHRRTGDLEAFEFVSARFRLEDGDVATLEARFGEGSFAERELTMARRYDGHRQMHHAGDEIKALAKIMAAGSDGLSGRPRTLAELDGLLAGLAAEDGGADDAARLAAGRAGVVGDAASIADAMQQALEALVPKFFYFADYSSLPGTIKIRNLLEADRSTLDDDELTALSLLELAGADNDYLLQPDYETRKRELENVANSLTADILDYWTTNQQIRVEIDITQRTVQSQTSVQNPNYPHQPIVVMQQNTVLDELRIRLRDDRHSLSLPFAERSTGFKWFFSFLAAFSAYEAGAEPVVILLDELIGPHVVVRVEC